MGIAPNYRIARSVVWHCGKEQVISVTRPVGSNNNRLVGGGGEKKKNITKMVDRNKLFQQNTNCRVFEHQ